MGDEPATAAILDPAIAREQRGPAAVPPPGADPACAGRRRLATCQRTAQARAGVLSRKPDIPRLANTGRPWKNRSAREARKQYEEVLEPRRRVCTPLVGLGRAEQGGDLASRDYHRAAFADASESKRGTGARTDGASQHGIGIRAAETPGKYYTVEPGDTLTVSASSSIPPRASTRANELTDATRCIGQRLKYTPKDFRVIVSVIPPVVPV